MCNILDDVSLAYHRISPVLSIVLEFATVVLGCSSPLDYGEDSNQV